MSRRVLENAAASRPRAAKRPKTEASSDQTIIAPTLTTDASAANAMNAVTEIAAMGDVIFVMSDGSRLRVLSAVLRLASPVFNVMFGPRFREGQNLDMNNPKDVPLLDDNPDAMAMLCRLLHHRYHLSSHPAFTICKELAYLTDKYGCTEALFATSALWVEHYSTQALEARYQGYSDLLGIAAAFNHPRAFFEISRSWMLNYEGSFCESMAMQDMLPPTTYVALGERTTRAKTRVREAANRVISLYFEGLKKLNNEGISERCRWHTVASGKRYCWELLRRALLSNNVPSEKASIRTHLDYYYRDLHQSSILTEWNARAAGHVCPSCGALSNANQLVAELKVAFRKIEAEFEGLCLACLKNGGKKSQENACAVEHSQNVW